MYVLRWPDQRIELTCGERNVNVVGGQIEYEDAESMRKAVLAHRFWWPGMSYELTEVRENADGSMDVIILEAR